MRYQSIIVGALGLTLAASAAFGQASRNQPSESAAPAKTYKEAVEKTGKNRGTRPLPQTEVAVLYLKLDASGGKVRRAEVERMLVVRSRPPKVFARSGGTWEVQLDGEQRARYRIQNPLQDVEIENPKGSRSPFSQVLMDGLVPVDLVVPLSRGGKNLAVQRIRIVDTETGKTIVDAPVRR